jgi:protein-disulfide isomerase
MQLNLSKPGVLLAIAAVVSILGFMQFTVYQNQQQLMKAWRAGGNGGPKARLRKTEPLKYLDIEGLPQRGDARAKVVLVEISDYQCPFCQRHMAQTFPALDGKYIRAGKIRYAFLDAPAESMHPTAMEAAIASHCAEDQGAFWAMHDNLFAKPIGSSGDVTAAARASSLEMNSFNNCVQAQKHIDLVTRRQVPLIKAGINGTPHFLIGLQNQDRKLSIISTIEGAQPLPVFESALDAALSEVSAQ